MRRSIFQVLFAQGVVLVASVLKSLILPIVLDVDGFAYWQVYVLYSGFVGVFALGYSDGVYLIYGDHDYSELPFERLRASIRFYMLTLLIFSVGVCSIAMFDHDPNHAFAIFFVGVDVFVTCLSGLLLYVLQITNQIKSYSVFVTVDKVAMIVLIGLILLVNPRPEFRMIIVADALTKVLVCAALVVRLKGLFFGPALSIAEGVRAYVDEAKVGVSLLFANLTGMLAVNAGRFLVEIFGSKADYAYYSFGVSVTNLVLTFVGAVALVIYPNLKRMESKRALSFFDEVDAASLKVVGVGFMLYAPSAIFVLTFIPKYEPMLAYLGFMFLAVAGQTKMQLLGNTYYKALREERRMLFVNIQAVALFLVIGGLSYLPTKSVTAIAASTALVLLYRAWASENELRRKLNVERPRKLLIEAVFCTAFVLATLLPVRSVSLIASETVGLCALICASLFTGSKN